jgi:putative addiction module component (TIGR02574 family)
MVGSAKNLFGDSLMATTLESLGIDRLSVAERIVLVQQIWDSIAIDPNQLPLTEAQRQELERRADDDDVNPSDTVPWEQVKAEALARWA